MAACGALAVLLGVGGWALVGSGDTCDPVQLGVVASPDIAPALDAVATRFTKTRTKIDGHCLVVHVEPRESATVAAGLASGAGSRPDVWVPDSSIWVNQVRSVPVSGKTTPTSGASAVPTNNLSIATSPTVIAMPQSVAKQIGGSSNGQISWAKVLAGLRGEHPLKVGFPDPTRNSVGVAALLAVREVTGTSAPARAQQVGLMRALSNERKDTTAELFAQFPQATDAASIANGLSAAPASEQSVWKYNSRRPDALLVARYPAEGSLRLNYPYVVTALNADSRSRRAADRFLTELQKTTSLNDLEENGFRSPSGEAGSAISPDMGLNPTRPPALKVGPSAGLVDQVLRAWRVVTLDVHMLALYDISASMNTKVPGINKTRLEVTVSAAQQGLGLFGDTSELGMWEFSTQLAGKNQDWRQRVSIGPLSEPVGDVVRRGALANSLATLQVKPNGSTGLYDTILAAYKTVQATAKPDKSNSVLVFTDGKNEDPTGGITLDGLLKELRRNFNPNRPIPINIVAFGPDVDMASASKIAQTTQGGAFHANTPADINNVFLAAVGLRECRPHC